MFQFCDVVEENIKLLDNYVAVEKEKVLAKKHIDEAVPIELNEIVDNAIDVKKEFHKHGEDCFETCSHAQIHSISEFVKSLIQINTI